MVGNPQFEAVANKPTDLFSAVVSGTLTTDSHQELPEHRGRVGRRDWCCGSLGLELLEIRPRNLAVLGRPVKITQNARAIYPG
jgi:hypothetical protein